MKGYLTIAAASALLCGSAIAQQAAVMPTPSLSATTPLAMMPSAPVGPTGIPLGATEIAAPGVSPSPTSPAGTLGTATCSTIGTAPSTMFGSTNTFDGGGVAVGTVMPQGSMSVPGSSMSAMSTSSSGIPPTSALIDTSGMSAMCGSGSGNMAASTTPTTQGGVPRTGIPLGSTEIGNLGVSSAAAVPTPGVTPFVSQMAAVPRVPAVTLPAPNTALAIPPPVDAATTVPPSP